MIAIKINSALVAVTLLVASFGATVPGFCAGQTASAPRYRILLNHTQNSISISNYIRGNETGGYLLRIHNRSLVGITVWGDGLDPYLSLLDASGTLLAADNDGGPGNQSRIERWLEAGDYLLDVTGYRGTTGLYLLKIDDIDAESREWRLSYGRKKMLEKVLAGGIIAGAYLGFAAYMRESRYDAEPRENPFGTLNAITGPAAAGFAAFTAITMLALYDRLGDGLNRYYAAPGAVALALGAGIIGAVAVGIGGFHFREEISGNRALYYGTSALTIAVPIFIYSID